MRKNLILWQLGGATALSSLGTLSHFLYDWTGSRLVALISAVNESTWEHMKLFFFPALVVAIIQYLFIGKEYKNFWSTKFKGILLGLILIPTIFYFLRGVFGTTPDWVNVAIFYLSVAIVFIYETVRLNNQSGYDIPNTWIIIALSLLSIAFFILTFYPIQIPLFQDPTNGSFGI